MGKSSNFFGQPVYGQLVKSIDREKTNGISRKHGGERYVKSFDGFTHLLTMLYAVIMRFDSLREISASMTAEVRKLHHIGIGKVPKRSTLSDANARRPEKIFEEVYRGLYEANKGLLSSDSRRSGAAQVRQLCTCLLRINILKYGHLPLIDKSLPSSPFRNLMISNWSGLNLCKNVMGTPIMPP